MTTTPQPPLPLAGALDPDTAAVVDLIGHDWQAQDDYSRFVVALYQCARADYVSQNDVRRALTNDYGLTIAPRRYSTLWRRACRDGHLTWDRHDPNAWDTNSDRAARNTGKPQRRYRLKADR